MNLWSINVPVSFEGTVRVHIPSHLPDAVQRDLAEKLALSRVLATTDNPDAPDEQAREDFAEFAQQYGIFIPEAEALFDAAEVESVGGNWTYKHEGETFKNKYAN